ncbi:hypothetical protein BT63DRAFT_454660 [Microthyrium microscopicum]|uniref:RNase H type-1 domain-containing protein n=1 Tax=Microthyrium microscopicum TaxID=703497 RepID=A0A6A6UFY2_9PEZI|nr:hypothetical protein BT63DRAFT_454660 [Microthyrium microscopicum]
MGLFKPDDPEDQPLWTFRRQRDLPEFAQLPERIHATDHRYPNLALKELGILEAAISILEFSDDIKAKAKVLNYRIEDVEYFSPPSQALPATVIIFKEKKYSVALEAALSKVVHPNLIFGYSDGSCGKANIQNVPKPLGGAGTFRHATSPDAYRDPKHQDWVRKGAYLTGSDNNEAEMMGIAILLRLIIFEGEPKPGTTLTIFVDGKNPLQFLSDPASITVSDLFISLGHEVIKLVHYLWSFHIDIHFIQIPGHTNDRHTFQNIVGNLIADHTCGIQQRELWDSDPTTFGLRVGPLASGSGSAHSKRQSMGFLGLIVPTKKKKMNPFRRTKSNNNRLRFLSLADIQREAMVLDFGKADLFFPAGKFDDAPHKASALRDLRRRILLLDIKENEVAFTEA